MHVCVCVTVDANSIALISNAIRYGKCGDESDLEQEVTSGSYRIKAGQKPPFSGHLPVSNLDLDLIYIIRYVLCCFIFSLVQIGCMYLIEGVPSVSVVFCYAVLDFESSGTELDRVIYYIGITYDGTGLGTVMVGVLVSIRLFSFVSYYTITEYLSTELFMCEFFLSLSLFFFFFFDQ